MMIPQKKRLEAKLKTVDTKNLLEHSLGLLLGYSGCILLLSHYFVLSKKQVYLDKMVSLINYCIRYINAAGTTLDLTMGYGLAGFCHTLHIIDSFKNPSFPSFNNMLNELDSVFIETFMKDETPYELDFFKGINGIINYAVNRSDLSPIVNKYVNYFNRQPDLTALWSSGTDSMQSINLGVPHGLAGNFFLVNKLVKAGYAFDLSFLNQIIDFLLAQNKIKDKNGFYFPGKFDRGNNERYTRTQMGWCYGDLPIGLALLEFSIINDLEQLNRFSLEILSNTLSRTDADNDSTLCHGAISISNLYYAIYELTGNNDFLSAKDYWLKRAIAESENDSFDKLFERESLFFGYSGYYLSLLTEGNRIESNWKELLIYK